jgi:hypothetical protein
VSGDTTWTPRSTRGREALRERASALPSITACSDASPSSTWGSLPSVCSSSAATPGSRVRQALEQAQRVGVDDRGDLDVGFALSSGISARASSEAP